MWSDYFGFASSIFRTYSDVYASDPSADLARLGMLDVFAEVAARIDQEGKPIAAGDHHSLHRRVDRPGHGIAGEDHRRVEVAPAVLQRVHRRRQLVEVDLALDDLVGRRRLDERARHRLPVRAPGRDRRGDAVGQFLLRHREQARDQVAVP